MLSTVKDCKLILTFVSLTYYPDSKLSCVFLYTQLDWGNDALEPDFEQQADVAASSSCDCSHGKMYMTKNPATVAILESLQGWLNKKKNLEDYKNKIFRYSGSEYNKRWFKIIEMKGFEEIELAIAYYGSHNDKEPKGWIYLKDVSTISDDTEVFTLVSPQRKLELEALSKAEHKLWLQGLVNLCHKADLTGIQSVITIPTRAAAPKTKIVEAKTVAPAAPAKVEDERQSNDALLANSKQLDNSLDFAADEKSVNSDGSYTPKKKILNREDKDDHRLNTFRPGHTTSASTRLHGHIRPGGAPVVSATSSKITQITDRPELPGNGIEYRDDSDSLEMLDISKPIDSSSTKATFGKLRRQLNEQKRSCDEASAPGDGDAVSITPGSPVHCTAASPESYMGQTNGRRPSVDDLLRSSPKLKVNFDGFGDDFDFKEERSRYSSNDSSSRGAGDDEKAVGGGGDAENGRKRPPRPPPAASKPPYAQKSRDNNNHNNSNNSNSINNNNNNNSNNSNNNNSNSNSNNNKISSSDFRKSTPPRRPVDPGIRTDENFVNDNWDGADAPPAKSGSGSGGGAKAVPKGQYKSGVRPDDNWLDEDFDD